MLEDVLQEGEDGRFALTPLGECLRDGVRASLRGQVLVRGDLYHGAAAGLLATIVERGTEFEHVHGDRFFALKTPSQRARKWLDRQGVGERGDCVAALAAAATASAVTSSSPCPPGATPI